METGLSIAIQAIPEAFEWDQKMGNYSYERTKDALLTALAALDIQTEKL